MKLAHMEAIILDAAPHYAYGTLQPCNKRNKILFAYEKLQMGKKMDVDKLKAVTEVLQIPFANF